MKFDAIVGITSIECDMNSLIFILLIGISKAVSINNFANYYPQLKGNFWQLNPD